MGISVLEPVELNQAATVFLKAVRRDTDCATILAHISGEKFMAGDIKPFTPGQEKFGGWIIGKVGRWQTAVYELTGGRLWNTFLGGPVAILTVTGRKTGRVRKIPLLYLKQGDDVVMTASKGGMSKLPVWYHNVVAADTVDIQVGADKKTYRMREATPEEEIGLWPQLEAMYPDYKEYRARTEGVRSIPILIFSPA